MNISVSSPLGNTGETALQREQQLFWELLSRLIDAFLNRMFDLLPAKSARRIWYLLILFVLSLFLVSLRFYPLGLWAKFIQDIFLYSLNPAYAAIYVGNPYTNFLAFITQVFTDPRIFQYLPVFLAPFFIALQCAALYLADVFELEHVSVARAYIWRVALSGSAETIRISQGDIADLFYKATSSVTPGQANPSAFEFSWVFNMIMLIRGRLSGFMSEHRLTSYLASIGIPELEKLKQREEMIVEQVQELTQSESDDDFLFPRQKKGLPEFQPRTKIKNLFSQFAEEFTKRAQGNGVELHWIGVGTWKVPTEIVPETKIVPEEHLEAWKLSNENLYRENSEVLDKLEKEAIIQKMIALIQDVPITGYQKAIGPENEQKKAMRFLLQDYRQQLLEAAEFLRAKGEAIPPNLEEAITHINNTLYHFI